MICTVYRLRQHGIRLREGDGLYMRGWDGALVYDINRRGEMCAQLFDLETSQEKMRIERARVVKARDGGLLISGEEMHYRALKDKGDRVPADLVVRTGHEGRHDGSEDRRVTRHRRRMRARDIPHESTGLKLTGLGRA